MIKIQKYNLIVRVYVRIESLRSIAVNRDNNNTFMTSMIDNPRIGKKHLSKVNCPNKGTP